MTGSGPSTQSQCSPGNTMDGQPPDLRSQAVPANRGCKPERLQAPPRQDQRPGTADPTTLAWEGSGPAALKPKNPCSRSGGDNRTTAAFPGHNSSPAEGARNLPAFARVSRDPGPNPREPGEGTGSQADQHAPAAFSRLRGACFLWRLAVEMADVTCKPLSEVPLGCAVVWLVV